MVKHTPGPWVVIDRTKEDYEPRFSVGWQAGMKGRMLERCVCWCLSCFGSGAETRANAYLIAAAPEMLETLEQIEKDSSGPGIRAAARQAIDAAKGESK